MCKKKDSNSSSSRGKARQVCGKDSGLSRHDVLLIRARLRFATFCIILSQSISLFLLNMEGIGETHMGSMN